MALPPRPQSATSTTAAPAATPAATPADGKVVQKRFAAATDSNGNTAAVPAVGGVDLLAISSKLWDAIKAECAALNVDVETVVAACDEVSKEIFPGHKQGRIAYSTADVIAKLGNGHALLNRTRSGVAPMTAMKAKLEEKDKKLAELEAKLAALMASMGK